MSLVTTSWYFVNSDEHYLVAQSSFPHKGPSSRDPCGLTKGLLTLGEFLVADEANVFPPTKTLPCIEIVWVLHQTSPS